MILVDAVDAESDFVYSLNPNVTKGICSMFPNLDKDAPLLYTRELEMTIQTVSRRFRKRIDQGIAAINRGAGAGSDGL